MPAKGGRVVHVEVSKQRTGRIALACKWAMSQVLKRLSTLYTTSRPLILVDSNKPREALVSL